MGCRSRYAKRAPTLSLDPLYCRRTTLAWRPAACADTWHIALQVHRLPCRATRPLRPCMHGNCGLGTHCAATSTMPRPNLTHPQKKRWSCHPSTCKVLAPQTLPTTPNFAHNGEQFCSLAFPFLSETSASVGAGATSTGSTYSACFLTTESDSGTVCLFHSDTVLAHHPPTACFLGTDHFF